MSEQDSPQNEDQQPESLPPTAATPPTQEGPLACFEPDVILRTERVGVPPILPGPLARPALGYASGAPPTWPTVIGVIGIVFGAGAVLMTLGGMAIALMMRNAPGMPPSPQFDERWMPWSVASMFVTSGVAILLLVAGIGLAKRRAWGPRLAEVWAVLKIVIVVASMVIGLQAQRETMEAMQQSAGPSPVPNLRVIMVLSMCAGLLWSWALPVFMLIWFSRPSVKEEIAKWS